MAQEFWVSGNLDQIKKQPALDFYAWTVVNTKVPNRVKTQLGSKEHAVNLVNFMSTHKMVVFKNWLD